MSKIQMSPLKLCRVSIHDNVVCYNINICYYYTIAENQKTKMLVRIKCFYRHFRARLFFKNSRITSIYMKIISALIAQSQDISL